MKITKLNIEYHPKVWGQELVFTNDTNITGDRPPLLIKIIEAKDNLSYQIHPNTTIFPDQSVVGNKDEVWYVLSATPRSRIGLGLLDHSDYHTQFNSGNVDSIVQHYNVSAGDFAYIESGTVHMLGAGISVLEIQQNNDITYRLYDYNRGRQLDLQKGLQNLHLHNSSFIQQKDTFTFASPYFEIKKYNSKGKIYIDNTASPYCYLIPLSGNASISTPDTTTLDNLQCYLISQTKLIRIDGECSFIIARPR
ncbi:MAG: class I mannose-6-phosphate isomerase [Clostridia bacterium]|nr:class I mannose-6-phosphate isomerase [Clostridia bacterium]